jgi:hypothetical protein
MGQLNLFQQICEIYQADESYACKRKFFCDLSQNFCNSDWRNSTDRAESRGGDSRAGLSRIPA